MTFTRTQKARLSKLADYLEKVSEEHFEMVSWFSSHVDGKEVVVGDEGYSDDYMAEATAYASPEEAVASCDTAACVAGHAAGLFKLRKRAYSSWGDTAGAFLGLDFRQADSLFTPDGLFDKSRTPKLAAKAVRLLQDTGEIPEWWSSSAWSLRTRGTTREALAGA